ncbi:MAG: zinc ribbon domain-containing protein [Ruminococcaceae bacterium]|nr:zinc ribbon domain-containing protein [Oscillospiraceae bacterium]
MNVKNRKLRVAGIVGAVILALPLLVFMIAIPLLSSTTSLLTPEFFSDVIRDMDYDKIVEQVTDQIADGESLPAGMVDDMMETDFADDLIELVTEDMIITLREGEPAGYINGRAIVDLAQEHLEDLVDVCRAHLPEVRDLSEAELKDEIMNGVRQYALDMPPSLLTVEDLVGMEISHSEAEWLSYLLDPTVLVWCVVITVLLAAAFFVCLLHRLRGMLWLGILAIVASLPAIVLGALLNIANLKLSAGTQEEIARSAVETLTGSLTTTGIVLAVLGVLLIIGFVIAGVINKKRAAALPTPVTDPTPVAQEAPAASRFCPNCGQPVQEQAGFCPHCGQSL